MDESVRAILNRSSGNELGEVERHSLIWRIFMTSSMQAAIFLGKDYFENLHSVRNTDKRPIVQSLFEVTQKLVHEQKLGISGLTDLSWNKSSWKKLALADGEESIKLMKAKVHVFPTLCCVSGKHTAAHIPTLTGKIGFRGSEGHIDAENWMKSTAIQWSSSGEFTQDTHHCKSSTRCRNSWIP